MTSFLIFTMNLNGYTNINCIKMHRYLKRYWYRVIQVEFTCFCLLSPHEYNARLAKPNLCAMSVCPSVRMNAEISKTIKIPKIPAQRKFVSAECHGHSNAHKPPKTVAPTVLMLE